GTKSLPVSDATRAARDSPHTLGPPLPSSGIRRREIFVAAPFIEPRRACQVGDTKKSGNLPKSMFFRVVEVALHGREQRRLVVTNAARGGLAADELGVAPVALHARLSVLTLEPYRDDVSVVVPVLHSRVLRHDDAAHRWLASSPPARCQRGLPPAGGDASMPA